MDNETKITEIERKREVEALYYIYNRSLLQMKDESSFQKARQEFISLFPEFSEGLPEKFDPEEIKIRLDAVRDILRSLPCEEKIWVEELAPCFEESFALAVNALTRNMKDILGEELPLPLNEDSAIEAYERLIKKHAEIEANAQSMTKAERGKYILSKVEVMYAGSVVLTNDLLRRRFKEPSTNPSNFLAHIYSLGSASGILTTLSKDYDDLLKKAHISIKNSEARSAGHAVDRELYKQAEKEADEYWKGGGKKFHHEMAKDLANKYFGKSDDRAPSMKKKLIPIAEKYGKVFGKKGVKKEN